MGIIRKTKSVEVLLNAFAESKMPISTLDLVEQFHHQMNRSTVYRILDRMEDHGILHSFTGQDGLTWYALSGKEGCSHSHQKDTHPHFQCMDCGKTECLSISIPIPEVAEHSIESVSFLLVGRCADCIG